MPDYNTHVKPAIASTNAPIDATRFGVMDEAGEIAVTDGARAPPLATLSVVTAPVTIAASGTPPLPAAISLTLLDVALKSVCAREISLLAMSYTTYALRRNVSPNTDVESPASLTPESLLGLVITSDSRKLTENAN
jgi:hypothetical protein